jgi:Zn-dependent metalloprotease
VHDAKSGTDLPGTVRRREGEPASGDVAVDEGYDGAGAVRETFRLLGHDSWDGAGAPVLVTVHYARDYVNAFWDGAQLVFGDGDGELFARFTRPLDVVAHEFAHGVIQSTAELRYEGQSGALNESVCDVFAAVTEQRSRDQNVEQADWLIGSDLFLPAVQGVALRSMKHPGTAYDDDRLGKDPQVATMTEYVHTREDNGGVHVNSGIPNRAFVLVATAIGGRSWETAAPIWWLALTGGDVGPDTGFAGFADATAAAAVRLHGSDSTQHQAVRAAWREVGVDGAAPQAPAGRPPSVVRVSRSGGFTGMVTRIELDPATDSRAAEVADLLASVDLASMPTGPPQPDRFIYTIDIGEQHVTFGEGDLPPQLGAVVRDALDR